MLRPALLALCLVEAGHALAGSPADRSATVAAVFCAEALTFGSPRNLASCVEHFRRARSKKLPGEPEGFRPDPEVLSLDGARFTLWEFEKRFGIASEEYLRRMMGSDNVRAELGRIVEKKVPPAAMDDLWKASALSKPEEEEPKFSPVKTPFVAEPGPAAAETQEPADAPAPHLRARHAEAGKARAMTELRPVSERELFGLQEEDPEPSLFETIRKKYAELGRRRAYPR